MNEIWKNRRTHLEPESFATGGKWPADAAGVSAGGEAAGVASAAGASFAGLAAFAGVAS